MGGISIYEVYDDIMEKLKERGCIEITQTENGKLIDDFIIEEEVSKKIFHFF
ncbi:hypothetical protein [Methanobrevibacter arboriphilus]|uniref:hypothetical protein n=1 Tax=Methanobrevibacter arboriphilus TaxID=39441 RepID=UPI000A788F4A|nr:hypothetical protein [Methanobrevibacter arboriphilus]